MHQQQVIQKSLMTYKHGLSDKLRNIPVFNGYIYQECQILTPIQRQTPSAQRLDYQACPALPQLGKDLRPLECTRHTGHSASPNRQKHQYDAEQRIVPWQLLEPTAALGNRFSS